MIVNFRVGNFKSFKGLVEFSMESTKLKNLRDSNVFDVGNRSLLKSASIFGANASGKSGLLEAIDSMVAIVKNSISIEKSKTYSARPFVLSSETENKETTFEMDFIIDEFMYRYGFDIGTDSTIINEWLSRIKLAPKCRFVKLFERKLKDISLYSNFGEGDGLIEKTRSNALFLSVVAQFNGEISEKITNWFDNVRVISNTRSSEFKHYSFEKLGEESYKERIVSFIKSADTGINGVSKIDLSFEDFEEWMNAEDREFFENMPDSMVEGIKKRGVSTIRTDHIQYGEEKDFLGIKRFELDSESDGTQKLLALSGPIIDTLDYGMTLIIDEIDNSLHTDLVMRIVELFNSKRNAKNAQLIFTTHDTNLLNQKLFRRDQVWFAEKDILGESEVYSLVEYGKGKARDDLALEKNYLLGKFGAVPHISSLHYDPEASDDRK